MALGACAVTGMEGLVVLIALVGLIALLIWKLVHWGIHSVWCVCERCRRETIEREIRRRAWSKSQNEIRRAVDEMMRASKGRPDAD